MRSPCLLCVATIFNLVILTNFREILHEPCAFGILSNTLLFFCIPTVIDNNVEELLGGFDY